jgi:hypothetical protein
MALYPELKTRKPYIKFPSIPPVEHDPALNTYHCPFCNKTIAQGNINRFQMMCIYCYQFINAEANTLVPRHSNYP